MSGIMNHVLAEFHAKTLKKKKKYYVFVSSRYEMKTEVHVVCRPAVQCNVFCSRLTMKRK